MRHRTKIWALAALLALAHPQQAMAVATTSVTVPNSGWTLLGAGPLQVTSNVAITYAISDTAPAIPFSGGFRVSANQIFSVASPSNVYALATGGPSATVWIAPLPASGTVSLTWPGSAPLTNYGVAPTGTVPAVNAFVTNPQTFAWPGTATLTNYGTAPTGTVPAVNAFVTNGLGTGGGPLGVQAIANSQAVNPATGSLWSTNASQWGSAAITNVPTPLGTLGTGNAPSVNAYIVGGAGAGGLSVVDQAGMIFGTSPFTPGGCVFNNTVTALASGTQGMVSCDANREVNVNTLSGSNLATMLSLGSFATGPPATLPSGGVLTGGKDVNGAAVPAPVDPCLQPKSFFDLSTATGTGTQLVAGVTGKKIYVCAGTLLMTSAASHVSLIEGSNSTCGIATTSVLGNNTASVVAANGLPFLANGGISPPGTTIAQTAAAGDYLCVLFDTANSPTVSTHVAYVQE